MLASPMVAEPLTRLMCSPIGDGAAATGAMSAEMAQAVHDEAGLGDGVVLGSGKDRAPGEPGRHDAHGRTRRTRWPASGPHDINVIELHDASAPAELMEYEELGLCKVGEGGRLIDEGVTALTARPGEPERRPALEGPPDRRDRLRAAHRDLLAAPRRSGRPSGEGREAKIGMTQNGGGMMRGEAAAMAIHILER